MSLDLWKEFGAPDQKGSKMLYDPNPKSNMQNDGLVDDDEFGDFEIPDVQQRLQPQKLSRIETDPNPKLSQQINENPDHSADFSASHDSSQPSRNSRSDKESVMAANKLLSSLAEKPPEISSNVPSSHENDDWGEFVEESDLIDVTPSETKSFSKRIDRQDSKSSKPSVDILLSTDPIQSSLLPENTVIRDSSEARKLLCKGPPPSNIPPPSVILCLITTLFQSLPSSIKNDSFSIDLASYCYSPSVQPSHEKKLIIFSIIRAAARIISGRKLRWRRDHHLSQSMKIGPAYAGKTSGMKLTGLDRTENRREDREAEEAMRTWKNHLGSLRSAVASANSHQPGLNLVVPELSEIIPVRQAKSGEGAIIASNCCFLCGLKRDERLEKIDVNVEDSFNEWWIDYWGHVDCTTFWQVLEGRLQQR